MQHSASEVTYLDFLIQSEAEPLLAKLSKSEKRDFLYRFLADLHRELQNPDHTKSSFTPSRKFKWIEYLALLCVGSTGWKLSDLHATSSNRSANCIPCSTMLNLLMRLVINAAKVSQNQADSKFLEQFLKHFKNLDEYVESLPSLPETIGQLGSTMRFALWIVVRFAVQCNVHSRITAVTNRRAEFGGKTIPVVPNLPGASQLLFTFSLRDDEVKFAEVNREGLIKLLDALYSFQREAGEETMSVDNAALKRLALQSADDSNAASTNATATCPVGVSKYRIIAESGFDLGALHFAEKRFPQAEAYFKESRLACEACAESDFDFERTRLLGYLSALESMTKAGSTPIPVATDDQPVKMEVDSQVPFRLGSSSSASTWSVPRDVLSGELVSATRIYASDAEANRVELLLGTAENVERVRELLVKLGLLPANFSIDMVTTGHVAASAAVRQTAASICEQFETVLSCSTVASAKQLALVSPHAAVFALAMIAKGVDRARARAFASADALLRDAETSLRGQQRIVGNNQHAQTSIRRLLRRVETERLFVRVSRRLHLARCRTLSRFVAACKHERELHDGADADADADADDVALTDQVAAALTEMLNESVSDALDDRLVMFAVYLLNGNCLDSLAAAFGNATSWTSFANRPLAAGVRPQDQVTRARFFSCLASLLREVRASASERNGDRRTSRCAKELFEVSIGAIFADAAAVGEANTEDRLRFGDWLVTKVLPELTHRCVLTLLSSMFAHAYGSVRAIASNSPVREVRPIVLPVSGSTDADSVGVECDWPSSVGPLLAACVTGSEFSYDERESQLHISLCASLKRLFDSAASATMFRSRSEPSALRLAADVQMLDYQEAAAFSRYLELASVLTNSFRTRSPEAMSHARPRSAQAGGAGWPNVHSELVQRLATLATQLGMHTHASVLWQHHALPGQKRSESDYAAACESIRESLKETFADDTDACYRFFCDVALLEQVAALHDRRSELPKRDRALELASNPFANENNSVDILDALTFRRKSAFFANLFDTSCRY